MDVTDEQRAVLAPLLTPPRREDGRGRPWREHRSVLNGVLWILRTGAPWKALPDRSPPASTVHRRLQRWVRDGTLERVLATLATDLEERGGIDVSECFVDGTFVGAKRGCQKRGGGCPLGGMGKTKRGKGTKRMAVADRAGPTPPGTRGDGPKTAHNRKVEAAERQERLA